MKHFQVETRMGIKGEASLTDVLDGCVDPARIISPVVLHAVVAVFVQDRGCIAIFAAFAEVVLVTQ